MRRRWKSKLNIYLELLKRILIMPTEQSACMRSQCKLIRCVSRCSLASECEFEFQLEFVRKYNLCECNSTMTELARWVRVDVAPHSNHSKIQFEKKKLAFFTFPVYSHTICMTTINAAHGWEGSLSFSLIRSNDAVCRLLNDKNEMRARKKASSAVLHSLN